MQIARDSDFANVCLDKGNLQEPIYLPEAALDPGRYYWRWSAGPAATSEVFAFEIAPDAVVVEAPPASDWLRQFPSEHPRIYVRPEEVPALRSAASDMTGARPSTLRREKAGAAVRL